MDNVSENIKLVSAALKKMRKTRYSTSEKYSYETETSRSQTSKLEGGKHNLTLKSIFKMIDNLGYSLEDLLVQIQEEVDNSKHRIKVEENEKITFDN